MTYGGSEFESMLDVRQFRGWLFNFCFPVCSIGFKMSHIHKQKTEGPANDFYIPIIVRWNMTNSLPRMQNSQRKACCRVLIWRWKSVWRPTWFSPWHLCVFQPQSSVQQAQLFPFHLILLLSPIVRPFLPHPAPTSCTGLLRSMSNSQLAVQNSFSKMVGVNMTGTLTWRAGEWPRHLHFWASPVSHSW